MLMLLPKLQPLASTKRDLGNIFLGEVWMEWNSSRRRGPGGIIPQENTKYSNVDIFLTAERQISYITVYVKRVEGQF